MAALLAFVIAPLFASLPAQAADRARIEAFLEITGFDVALDSIALSAGSAPQMIGLESSAFGADWERMSRDVFDTEEMRGMALEILEETLTDEALSHAADFYASDLGQRLVKAENASHMVEDDEIKQLAGERIIADLVEEGAGRVQLFQRMSEAIGSASAGLKAVQQIQFRFLMAAAAAGVIDLEVDADGLRALLKEQEGEILLAMQASSLAGNAYTYQGFTDAELEDYAEALEQPLMQEVYELLNAVQNEITANRFEVLAYRMAEMHPGQDI
jgi:hypothetical protein